MCWSKVGRARVEDRGPAPLRDDAVPASSRTGIENIHARVPSNRQKAWLVSQLWRGSGAWEARDLRSCSCCARRDRSRAGGGWMGTVEIV